MPSPQTTERHKISSSLLSMANHSRSFLTSFRHSQVASMDQVHEVQLQDLNTFQSHVASQLSALTNSPLASIQLLHNLLDSFLNIQNEFNTLLINNPTLISRTSSERPFSIFLDGSVKSLDICNELSRVVQSIRCWNAKATTVATAVKNRQHERARRAMSKLKLYSSASFLRNWSFGKKLQAVPMNGGVETAMYTMSYVMAFVMNALVWAIGDASMSTHLVAPPRQLVWATPMIHVFDKIWRSEVSVKKETEKYVSELMDDMDVCKAMEAEEGCVRLEDDLVVLEKRLRELFRRIVEGREVVLKCLGVGED